MDYQSPTPSDSITSSSSQDDYESARSTTPPTRESSLPPPPPTSNHDHEDLLSHHLQHLNLHPSESSLSEEPTPATATTAVPMSLRTCVIFQEACIRHKYIRNDDISTIVERPERIRAVKIGVSNAWARLEGRWEERGKERWVHKRANEEEGGLSEEKKGDGEGLDGLMKGLSIGTITTTDNNTSTSKSTGTTTTLTPKPPSRLTTSRSATTTPTSPTKILKGPFDIIFSTSLMSPSHPALNYIHPLPNLPPPPSPSPSPSPSSPTATPETWPHQLLTLCRLSPNSILSSSNHHSEIPQHLPQGDLYLCPGSEEAIFGALGAVEEGVERVVEGVRKHLLSLSASDGTKKEEREGSETENKNGVGRKREEEKVAYSRAFVAIRPPGHHCGEDEPMGFCFVNNLAVGVAHAHQKYGIDRIVIFDIDLHHGNGTQDIVWRINAAANEAYLKDAAITPSGSPKKGGSPRKRKGDGEVKRELQVHFASLHDVFSYPCEDGNPSMVQSASLNLSGGHSQFISNVHLEPWVDEDDFHERLYERYKEGLLGSAKEFLEKMRGREGALERGREEERTMVFVSAGFDASIHESAGMSRHRRNVPTSFYHRFALDVCQFAEEFAEGKLVSILEGGYSDRALASSSLAMLVGMTEGGRGEALDETGSGNGSGVGEERTWWEEKNLLKLEKGVLGGKKKVGRPASAAGKEKESAEEESWLSRTVEIFSQISGEPIKDHGGAIRREKEKEVANAARSMQLRERRPRGPGRVGEEDTTPIASPRKGKSSPAKTSTAPPPPVVSTPQQPPPTLLSAPQSTATTILACTPPPIASLSIPQQEPIQPTPLTTEPRDEVEETQPIVPFPKVKFIWREGGL